MSRSARFVLAVLVSLLAGSTFAGSKNDQDIDPPPFPPARLAAADAVLIASARELQRPELLAGARTPEIDATLATHLAAARARWEWGRSDLIPGSVIPLVGPDGSVVAWDVDFRFDGGSFDSPSRVSREWRDRPLLTPSQQAKSGVDLSFYSVTVSATWDAPPIRASRTGVTNFYAAAPRVASAAAELLSVDDVVIERVYPQSSWARAYEFSGGGRRIVIEGQEPWRWWEADEFEATATARRDWKQERLRRELAAKGINVVASTDKARADNQAVAQKWLDGAMPDKNATYISDLDVFEPFFWYAGCSPTSGSMVLNYYDRRFEGGLGVGLLNRWYSQRQSPVTLTGNCRVPEIAERLPILMDTDDEGSTSIFDIRPGLKDHVEERGYCDGGGPDWLGDFTGWEWDGMVNELNLSRPFCWSSDFYPGADGGHTVAAVGYESSTQDLYCYNTWNDGGMLEAAHHSGGFTDWSSIDGVTPSCYESQADIRLTSLRGWPWYATSGACEVWGGGDAGCPFPITWENSLGTTTMVKVYTSNDAGRTWTFLAETDDDGEFAWTPTTWPSWTGRVRLDRVRYEAGQPVLVASDGSPSDFQITAPEPHPCLLDVDTLHFDVAEFGDSELHYIHIENFTCDAISTPVVVGSDDFEITPPSFMVEPGNEDWVYVTFRPTICGLVNAVLTFPDTPCAIVQLIAQGPSEPVCNIAPLTIDMPFDQLGQPVQGTFTIRNDKCGTVAGVLTPDNPSFRVAPAIFNIGGLDSLEVTVTFTPSACAPESCTIDTGPLCQDVTCTARDLLTLGDWQDATTGPLADAGLGTGVAAGDYDGDGDDDLYLVRYDQPNVLLRNDGGLVFTDVTTPALANSGMGFGAAWGDLDNDGDLDLCLTNTDTDDVILRNDGVSGFHSIAAPGLAGAAYSLAAAWVDIEGDGDLDLYIARYAEPNLALRNDGVAGFTRVSTLPLADPGNGWDASWGDWDNDGDPDLYLANYGGRDVLMQNDGAWNFSVFANPDLFPEGSSFGGAWGDIDNDGDLDLYVAKYTQPSFLYLNDAGTRLIESTQAPLDEPLPISVLTWTDLDLDGDVDLSQHLYGTANRLLRNDGGAAWVNIATGVMANTAEGYGQAWGDFDRDGREDTYLNTYNTSNLLCLNEAADITCRTWLQVDLQGVESNRFGVGARVTVVAGGRRQIREVGAGEGGFSQNSHTAAFGLGSTAVVDSVIVRWPWRATQIHTGLPVNQRLTVVENGGVSSVREPDLPAEPRVTTFALRPAFPNPFNPNTRIPFDLPRETRVTLSLHDAAGRHLRTLVDSEIKTAGQHSVQWDGRDAAGRSVSSGVYFCRLVAGREVRLEKLVLLR